MLRRGAAALALVAALPAVGLARPYSAGPYRQVAQVQEGGRIQEIRVVGSERIEPETVRSYLTIQPSDAFSNVELDKSLKALYATGLFADVSLQRDGNALIIRVVENPVVNQVSFENNHHFDEKKLGDEIQMKTRSVYTRTRVQADVKRLLDLYRRSGRFAATVEPKIVRLPQNRVDLVYEINEGDPTRIESINFIGNKEFGNGELQSVISTRESRWYRLFSSSDNFDPDRLSYDRELLRKYYLSQGYADFRVTSAIAELTPDRTGFIITFTVEEGNRYDFGHIGVHVAIPHVNSTDLESVLTSKEGNVYNANEVENSVTALSSVLGDRGYAFVNIQPRLDTDRDKKLIGVTYEVGEAPRVYVERVDVTGNARTLDKVIRREFTIAEGDAYSTSKVKRSEQNVKNLSYFKKVDVTNAPGSAPDKTIINAKVEEQSTGELSVGAGYSTGQGILGSVSIHEANLLGRGQDLRLSGTLAQYEKLYDLSFTEPYFLDKPIAAGVDLFSVNRNNATYDNYNLNSIGGTTRLGFQMGENLRATYSYTLRDDRVTNILDSASTYIKDQKGTRIAGVLGQVLLYDQRDNRQEPTAGYYLQSDSSLAGGVGNVRFGREILSGGYYISLFPKWILGTTLEGGVINGIGKDVSLQDRFFLGGDNLRGFADAGVGPHDTTTGDTLGGNMYYAGSFTLRLPLGLPEDYGISGRLFTDFGSLYGLDQSGVGIIDSHKIRVASGIGFSWKSPFGPIVVDLGVPLSKAQHDRTQVFRVNFGTRF